jgi:hypothetical protein
VSLECFLVPSVAIFDKIVIIFWVRVFGFVTGITVVKVTVLHCN